MSNERIFRKHTRLFTTLLRPAKTAPSSTAVCPANVSRAHLRTHYLADGTFNPFGGFKFAGTVRPKYPLSPKRAVPDHIERPDYADDGTVKRFFRGFTLAL